MSDHSGQIKSRGIIFIGFIEAHIYKRQIKLLRFEPSYSVGEGPGYFYLVPCVVEQPAQGRSPVRKIIHHQDFVWFEGHIWNLFLAVATTTRH